MLTKRMFFCFVLLIATFSCVEAQPWQWQRFDGEFYNPLGFPQPSLSDPLVVGDFDGDGADEFLQLTTSGFLIAKRDSSRFHWSAQTFTQSLGYGSLCAVDADSDGAKELIVNGNPPHGYKLISTNPWTWQQRDDLIEHLVFANGWNQMIFGDYDGDGLLNAVMVVGEYNPDIRIYTRQNLYTWAYDSSLQTDGGLVSGVFDGDFDHDGDVDFAVAPLYSDVPPYAAFCENTGHGLVVHPANNPYNFALTGPAGGDLDGDGQWEGLFFPRYYSGLSLVETEAAPPPEYVLTASSRYLGPAPDLPLGTFRTDTGEVIAAVHSYRYGDPFFLMGAFDLMAYTPLGWVPFSNGFHEQMGPEFRRGNMADLDGDGHEDIVAALVSHQMYSDSWSWEVSRNVGTDSADIYPYTRVRVDNHLPGLPNCYAESPQIGDITGDGRAELAVLPHLDQTPPRIIFYEMIGSISDTTFLRHDEWSAGLPDSLLAFCLDDIDGDGLAEVIAKTTGDTEHGHWEVYFRRTGEWERYANILPDFDAPKISFADFDRDGDLDLFTPTDVWINMTPSKARDGVALHPAMLTLSAFPNPFNPQTTIQFDLPRGGFVTLRIYDLLGRELETLVDKPLTAGSYRYWWNGSKQASGMYFAVLNTGTMRRTQKLMMIK